MPQQKLLDPSELGTKEYWEASYVRELHNFTSNPCDEGTIWFDESDAETRVLRALRAFASPARRLLHKPTTRFLDLGTGNGHMLFALRENEDEDEDDDDQDEDGEGSRGRWQGDMLGIDYSPASVQFAREVNASRMRELPEGGEGYARVRFEQGDVLLDSVPALLGTTATSDADAREGAEEGFDVVLDKGTFDAISLMAVDASPQQQQQQQHPCEVYRDKVMQLVRPGGFLFITSCNWTKEELLGWLEGGLRLFEEVEYPTFRFGGVTGQSVVTLVLERVRG